MLRPNELMRQKYCFGRLLAVLAAFCLLLSSCGGKPESAPEPNLFRAVISVEDSRLAPKVADFWTTEKEVRDIFLHANSTLFSNETDVVIRDISIDGLTYKEIFSFYKGWLLTVAYAMQPETQEEFEEISQRLAKEAAAFMPAEMLMNENGVQASEGSDTYWKDEAGNRVTFSFTTPNAGEQPTVYLQIWQEPDLRREILQELTAAG